MEKSPIFLGAVGSVDGQTGVSLAVNKEHARQRRALGYLFTNSALLHFESVLHLHIDKFLAVLKTMASEKRAVDFSAWCKPFPRTSVCASSTDNTQTPTWHSI